MRRIDCKGFTLVELMAVITILVILSLVIVPIIDKNVKRSKQEMYDIQIENIRMAGVNYFSDNFSLRPSINSYCSISLDSLISNGYMSSNVYNPKTGESFENLYIQILNSGDDNHNSYSYLVCPLEDECEDISQICS